MSQQEDRPTGWFLAGYAGVAGFFLVEQVARQRGTAASLDASGDDQGTTRGIVTASVAAATLAPLLRRVPVRSAAALGGTGRSGTASHRTGPAHLVHAHARSRLFADAAHRRGPTLSSMTARIG